MAAGIRAQTERAVHPRITAAIIALRNARAYPQATPQDFGGHNARAIRAPGVAIRQLNLVLAYREQEDPR